jgi:hypothetical protein
MPAPNDREAAPRPSARAFPISIGIAERTRGSESLLGLIPALIAARAAMPPITKDKFNPHFNSRYADLASIRESAAAPLRDNGLCILQTTRWIEGELFLNTSLVHTSGEFVTFDYPVFADYGNPQKLGAALTYARRLSMQTLLDIAPEDDDGETAMGRGPGRQEPRRDQRPQGQRRERERSREDAPDRQSINEAFTPTEDRAETWQSYIGPRLRAVHAGWMREMVAADVPPEKQLTNKELAREPQMVNHLCSRLIELGRITGASIGKDGNPEVRDVMRARTTVMQAFAKSPAAIKRAVDKHLSELTDEARARLGMPSSGEGEGREPEGVPAGAEEHWPAGRE